MATKKETLVKTVVKELSLSNVTRYMVPVMLKRNNKLVQVNIAPRSSIKILPTEITDSVVNLTTGSGKSLVLK